ncbi:TonB-dependent receptor [Terriglobus roseus]|uniref:Carboxypeptidase regulatory-like domain-containing protein n=1 Tax=Terriglobus roseus TaxID=392734 RepID=A0A1G7EMB1_9BACT|nr:TonB-dependent receptor [Terriglobus roseus]SDE64838.1 Carboxypeptidase regulatory-like domain-containing protein [Terriglobus roseus]
MNNRMFTNKLWATAVLACSLTTASAFAQSAALGGVSGVVRDNQGAVVPNASVTVINTGTGAKRELTTDGDGHYVATFLQPGQYEVIVTAAGFGKLDQKNVTVTVGVTNTVDAALPAASVATDVTVTTDSAVLDVDKTDVSQTVSEHVVANLPVNGRRFDNFVLLTPNVAPDGNTGLLSFRGISGLYNTNLVDGANNNQAFFSEARGRAIGAPYVFPIDAIKEFQAASSGYSAEFGQAAGGVINAITKSGTNSFHGTAYEYYRTPGYNALDAFSKSQKLYTQPVKVQHQFGVSVGGPIIKDKLFFHAVYDGYRRINPITYTSTYNTSTQNIGQLVALCDGRTSGYLTRGNTIYPSTIPNISLAQCQQAVTFATSSLLGTFARNTTQDIYLPRLDYQLSSKTHLSASFLFENLKQPNGYNSSPTVSNGSITQNGAINFHERFLFVNAETAINSNTANVVHFQWSRDLETAGTNTGGPANNLTNLYAYGETSALPRGAFPDEHRWQITDIVSKTIGKHTAKVGVDVNLIHEQIANLFGGNGQFNYSNSSAEYNFASWIQDVYQVNGGRHYNSFSQTADPITGIGADDFWNKNLDVFAQDDWKITPKLMLSMGVRYDVQLVPQPDKPNTANPVALAATQTINTDYHMFAPRFGFSWNPQDGTVVRGGYGIFYGLTSNSLWYTLRRENGVYQQQFSTPTVTVNAYGNAIAGTPAGQPNVPLQQPTGYASYAPQGGIPAFLPPGPAPKNLVTGTAITPVNPGLPSSAIGVRGASPNFLNPYTHSFDLAVEQQLPFHTTLTIGYVGTRGMRLPIYVDSNVDPTSAINRTYQLTNATGQVSTFSFPYYTKRLYTSTTSVLTGYSDVNSWYHSGVFSVRKPFANGFEVLANYTWARTMDAGQSGAPNGTFNGTDSPIIPFAQGHRQGRGAEYARSDIDQRGRFVGTLLYKTNFKLGNRYAAYAANGWQIAGTVTAQTGFPITGFINGSITSQLNGDGGISGAQVTSGTGYRVPDVIARRNGFTGPGVHNTDMRISREFPIWREMRLELSAEAFNIANHRNILAVNTSAYSYTAPTTAASPTSCAATNTGGCFAPYSLFYTPTSTSSTIYGSRQLQLLGRLYF